MNREGSCFLLLILCIIASDYQVTSDGTTSLSRRKRYVVFPEGSTFSVSSIPFSASQLYSVVVANVIELQFARIRLSHFFFRRSKAYLFIGSLIYHARSGVRCETLNQTRIVSV